VYRTQHWTEQRQARIRGLIQTLYATAAELEEEFEGRSIALGGQLIGSIGEVVAAYAFDLILHPAGDHTHDAVSPTGVPVQIKLAGGLRPLGLNSEPRHLLVLQLQDDNFQVAYNGPGAPVWSACGPAAGNGQRPISLAALHRLNLRVPPHAQLTQYRNFPEVRSALAV
jgi:hypothetical protein